MTTQTDRLIDACSTAIRIARPALLPADARRLAMLRSALVDHIEARRWHHPHSVSVDLRDRRWSVVSLATGEMIADLGASYQDATAAIRQLGR